MHEVIRNKQQMYAMLAAGEFGNTIPQYFSVADWRAGDAAKYETWGVRTLTPGGPCRLNCPREEVEATVAQFAPHKPNISCMVDKVATVMLWADVWDSPDGLMVYGIEYPKTEQGWTWRNSMPTRGQHWQGIAARMLLRKHLNANSLDDLLELFERYPGHVAELSALDRCFGTLPHRNTVMWEVRMY